MRIDNISPQHAYLQLAALLRDQIATGQIVSKLPSLTDLTAQTHLAVGTVRRAIDVLVGEQLVQVVPGRGTFVTSAGIRHADRDGTASPQLPLASYASARRVKR